MVRVTMSALIVLAALYVAVLMGGGGRRARMGGHPPGGARSPTADTRRVDYTSDDGQPLFAYLAGDPSRATGLLIAYHGNADLAAWVAPWASEVERATGWAVLVPEYRGYGGLNGSPAYLSSQRDARATYRLSPEQF